MDETETKVTVTEQTPAIANMEDLWNAILILEKHTFHTAKGLSYTYIVKGNEIFFSRKEKSVTRSTVEKAYEKVLELNGEVQGPKKLGVFGASYLYPVFVEIGLVHKNKGVRHH